MDLGFLTRRPRARRVAKEMSKYVRTLKTTGWIACACYNGQVIIRQSSGDKGLL